MPDDVAITGAVRSKARWSGGNAGFVGPGVSKNVINDQKGITTPNGQGQRVE